MEIRTRFAPSPTGYLHIGSLRAALYEYAFAKHDGGKFILRVEDTDRNRYVPGATEKLIEQLETFGLNWDEGPRVGGPYGPYIQSERVVSGIYKEAAYQLIDSGHAFFCFCKAQTKEEINETHQNKIVQLRDPCRNLTKTEIEKKLAAGEKPAIRLLVPENETISYFDFVLKKEVSWNSDFVDDAMLLKSDGLYPTYQLGVVVDDSAMKMTHIFRGMEWLPSTPIHLLLFRYLGYSTPQIGHMTDILDPAGGKLSKRKGNVSTEDFLAQGYLKEAILNFIMLVGWAPKNNREIFTLEEFVEAFDVDGLQKAHALFNPQKLNWFNQQYIKALDNVDLAKRIVDREFTKHEEEKVMQLLPLVKDRMITLKDFDQLTGYFFETPTIDTELFNTIQTDSTKVLKFTLDILEKNWDGKVLEEKARKFCAENNVKVGDFFMILRIALTGRTATPPLWEVVEVLGKEEVMSRLTTVYPSTLLGTSRLQQ